MVGNVTIQGQIVGTATFDGAKISAVVTIAPPINATVVFGRSGVSVHNLLSDRDAEDAHPIASITDLPETLQAITDSIPAPLGFTPENVANKKTTLTNSETDYPSTSAVNRLTELEQTDSPEFANTQITTLQSDATGGIILAAEAAWLGATAKSVLSYLQKLVSKVYSINTRVDKIEDNGIGGALCLSSVGDYLTASTIPTTFINSNTVANLLYVSPCIFNLSFVCNELKFYVNTGVALSKIKFVVYSEKDKMPFSKLYESAEFNMTATGDIVDSSINLSFDKTKIYYIGYTASAAVSVKNILAGAVKLIKNNGDPTSAASYKNAVYSTLAYGSAIPSVFPAFLFDFGNIPAIRLKISSLL